MDIKTNSTYDIGYNRGFSDGETYGFLSGFLVGLTFMIFPLFNVTIVEKKHCNHCGDTH